MNPIQRAASAALISSALASTSIAQAFRTGFEPAGASGGVFALATFDDGSGTKLFAAGEFASAGAAISGGIARWNHASGTWSSLAGGVDGRVGVLTTFDEDGSGPQPARLFAGGAFDRAGSVTARNVARWNGVAWSPLGGGTDDWVAALASFDPDGAGSQPASLYAGGLFENAGGVPCAHVARWNGSSWQPLGLGVDGPVTSMISFDADGAGPQPPMLYVGGLFHHAGGLPADGLARWNGSTWVPIASGVSGSESAASVNALAVFDEDGAGPQPARLIVGGSFASAGPAAANGIARFDGTTFTPLATGVSASGSFPNVRALAVFDDGSGARLFASGLFRNAGGVVAIPDSSTPDPLLTVARWDGTSWQPLGFGIQSSSNGVGRALAVLDEGGTNRLYVGGMFSVTGGQGTAGIARWNGSSWQALGTGRGTDGEVLALAAFPGTGAPLAVGGSFRSAGNVAANRVALWNDASGNWQPLGGGVDGTVRALEVHGGALYAGGDFTTASGATANHVARFTGSSWVDLGGGTNGRVLALQSHQGRLYAAGEFSRAGIGTVSHVASWDGAQWAPLANGTDDTVRALASFDETGGSSPTLFAAGDFLRAGGANANGVARWDGVAWTRVGTGLCCGSVNALAVWNDGNGAKLYAAGDLDVNGDGRTEGVLRWNPSTQTWTVVGSGISGGHQTAVLALTPVTLSGISYLAAGGDFDSASGVGAHEIALWNGSAWSTLGSGMDAPIRALRAAQVLPGGEALFAGGAFSVADGRPSARFARTN